MISIWYVPRTPTCTSTNIKMEAFHFPDLHVSTLFIYFYLQGVEIVIFHDGCFWRGITYESYGVAKTRFVDGYTLVELYLDTLLFDLEIATHFLCLTHHVYCSFKGGTESTRRSNVSWELPQRRPREEVEMVVITNNHCCSPFASST